MANVGEAVGYLDLDISKFLANLKSAQSQANNFSKNVVQQTGDKLQGIGKSMETAGSKMTKSVTVPIVGLGTAILKTSMDFEAGMSKVEAISGATGDELTALTAKAREMGAKTKFSATEATEAFQYMAMAGWETADMLASIDGVMNLAAASGESLGTVSDIVTDAMTAFGMAADGTSTVLKDGLEIEVSNCTRFVDALAAASNSSNTNVSMMGESFKYVAPVAGALGYSVEDTAVALGLMANQGIKASNAGTALRTILTNMAKPTETMQAAMDTLGVSLENDEGQMYSLMEVMQNLRQGFGGGSISAEEFSTKLAEIEAQFEDGTLHEAEYEQALNDLCVAMYGAEGAQKAQLAASLAGKTGMAGLLAIVNTADEDFQSLTESIYNASGTSQEMADIMQNNLAGQLTILKSQLQEVALQLGEVLMPIAKDFVGSLQNMVSWFSQLSPGTQAAIVKFAMFAAVIGPLLLVFGKIITTVGKATSFIGGFIGKIAGLGSAAASAAAPVSSAGASVGVLSKNALGLVAAGAGILLAAAGLALLAYSAVQLASAGWPAIACMGGLVVALAALAAGATLVAAPLTAGAVGLVAFGAALALVGVGVLAASAGMTLLATQLPTISEYGTSAAIGILALGGALTVFSAGALLAGAACVALGAGLVVVAGGMVAAGAAAAVAAAGTLALAAGVAALSIGTLVLAAGMLGLGAGLTLCGAGMSEVATHVMKASVGFAALGVAAAAAFVPIAAGAVSTLALAAAMTGLAVSLGAVTLECGLLAAAVAVIALSMNEIDTSARSAASSLTEMVASVDIVKTGLGTLGDLAASAVGAFVGAFSAGVPSASASALAMGNAVTTNIQTGLAPLPSMTQAVVNQIVTVVNTGTTQIHATTSSTMNAIRSDTSSGMSSIQATVSSGMSAINSAIVSNLSSAAGYIKSLAGQAYGWGADIIKGLTKGILANLGSLSSAVNSAANIIHSRLHFSVPDEGPLTDYESWMPDFVKGLAKGIVDNEHYLADAVTGLAGELRMDPIVPESVALFDSNDVAELEGYNVTLVNTVELYRQLVEQVALLSEYAIFANPMENGLMQAAQAKETVIERERDGSDRNNDNDKPDQLVIPITIGEEHIEDVVVDLLRREVRT